MRRFNDVVEGAGTGEKSAIRVLQAWHYLIGKAANRQIVKYDELRRLMEYPNNHRLNKGVNLPGYAVQYLSRVFWNLQSNTGSARAM